jgi:hypothetical protein
MSEAKLNWIYGVQDDTWYVYLPESRTCYVVYKLDDKFFVEWSSGGVKASTTTFPCSSFEDGKEKCESIMKGAQPHKHS